MQVTLNTCMTLKDGHPKFFAKFKILPHLSAACNNCSGVLKLSKWKTPRNITDYVDLVFQNFWIKL